MNNVSTINLTTLDNVYFEFTFDDLITTNPADIRPMPNLREIYQLTGDLLLNITSQIVTHDCVSVLFKNLYGVEHQLLVKRVQTWNAPKECHIFKIETTLSEKREWSKIGISAGYNDTDRPERI